MKKGEYALNGDTIPVFLTFDYYIIEWHRRPKKFSQKKSGR
ncbi:MAG: hypothetical protein ACI4DX_09740 [Oliverpabstia sp.]|nr:hypothetical protein [Oliverpabstia sp.]